LPVWERVVVGAVPSTGPGRRRIVLTTFGSDLHPYIAVALGLKAVIATSALYRQKVKTLGIGFRAVPLMIWRQVMTAGTSTTLLTCQIKQSPQRQL
jgi:hypothetical protein